MTNANNTRYTNRTSYNNKGWEVVRLADYFATMDSSIEVWPIVIEMEKWCKENVPAQYWERNGVTRYSYRFQFKDKQDALAFKLTFPT